MWKNGLERLACTPCSASSIVTMLDVFGVDQVTPLPLYQRFRVIAAQKDRGPGCLRVLV